jgi:predicted DCC family thiol-disulfide oxidoreductase YuxK
MIRSASRWAPRPAPGWPDGLILFDGVCVLCSNFVRMVLERDEKRRFRFATVQSPIGQVLSRELGINPAEPETNAVVLDGVAYMKSDANLVVLSHLRGKARLAVFRRLPRGFRDFLYDRIARNRYRLFGRTETCMLPPPDMQERFLDGLDDLRAAPTARAPSS